MPPVIEARFCRLSRSFDQRRTLFYESDRQVVRPRLHCNPRLQRLFIEDLITKRGLRYREGLHRLPVQQHQHLVRTVLAQTTDDSRQIPHQ